MKVCYNCKNTLDDAAVFCDKCGARLVAQNNDQNGYYQQPGNNPNYYQQPVNNANYTQPPYNYAANQQQYQPAPKAQPKKKNTGLIIALVAVVLILLAIIGSTAEKLFQQQGYGSSNVDDTPAYTFEEIGKVSINDDVANENDAVTENVGSAVAYNKGTATDDVYTNEWANLCVDIGPEWSFGSAAEYASYQGDYKTECGLVLNNNTKGQQLAICYEMLTGFNTSVTEETYLEVVAGSLPEQYKGLNLQCHISEPRNAEIAGEKYMTLRASFEGESLVQDVYVRKLDDYMIIIAVTAQSSADAEATVNAIRAAH